QGCGRAARAQCQGCGLGDRWSKTRYLAELARRRRPLQRSPATGICEKEIGDRGQPPQRRASGPHESVAPNARAPSFAPNPEFAKRKSATAASRRRAARVACASPRVTVTKEVNGGQCRGFGDRGGVPELGPLESVRGHSAMSVR